MWKDKKVILLLLFFGEITSWVSCMNSEGAVTTSTSSNLASTVWTCQYVKNTLHQMLQCILESTAVGAYQYYGK